MIWTYYSYMTTEKDLKKKRCWIVVGDVVQLKLNNSLTGAVTSVNAGAFATWIEVLWNDGRLESVPIESVEIVGDES